MIYFLSLLKDTPTRGYWDYGILEDLLSHTGLVEEEVRELPKADFGIVVIPARSHHEVVKQINKELKKLKGVVLFLMGDEESVFPVEKIKHDNIRIYLQNPKPQRHDKYGKLGTGYQPLIHGTKIRSKDLDIFFSGQVTHERRELCIEALNEIKDKKIKKKVVSTKGFTQGLEPKEFYETMARAKVAPCPAGPCTPDTFRLFEALELGAVPIADNETPKEDWTGFWEWLFEEPVPFPTISDYDSLRGYIEECLDNYPVLNNRVQAWWLRYKNKMRRRITTDIAEISGTKIEDKITVIVPISPIASHPDISIVKETLDSVRAHLSPFTEIILTFDGVREEQEDLREEYEESIRRVLATHRDLNIIPYIFEEHMHQAGMMREIMEDIKTPVILYMEQDAPLVTDYTIPLYELCTPIENGDSNLIRFHFEGKVPKAHEHLMIGEVENELLKTVQWSQRPHLASTAFYKRLIEDHFSKKAKCFIEDLAHGKVQQDFQRYGEQGWHQWRLHIYHPEGNIKRSYHTDGRAGKAKFDDTQIW